MNAEVGAPKPTVDMLTEGRWPCVLSKEEVCGDVVLHLYAEMPCSAVGAVLRCRVFASGGKIRGLFIACGSIGHRFNQGQVDSMLLSEECGSDRR